MRKVTEILALHLSKMDLRCVLISHWTTEQLTDFHILEEIGFRKELQYSDTELRCIADQIGFEGLLIYKGREVKASLLLCQGASEKELHLDTIIVSPSIKGLGGVLMKLLIEHSAHVGWSSIQLNTENKNEKGYPLVQFYQHFGFEVLEIEANGNVSMLYTNAQH